MVVAGVGVKHDELVKYVEKYFINEEPIWKSEKIQSSGANKVDTSLAQYTGGLKIVRIASKLHCSMFNSEIPFFRKNVIFRYTPRPDCPS